MKIRTGFVSNSSSSSFIVVGDILDINNKELILSNLTIEDKVCKRIFTRV